MERIEAAARAGLSPGRCAAERARGASLTVEDVVDQLRARTPGAERPAATGR